MTPHAESQERPGAEPIEHAGWCASQGRSENDPLYVDPLARLLDRIGDDISADEIQSVRRAERDRLLAAAPPAAGLAELLDQARAVR